MPKQNGPLFTPAAVTIAREALEEIGQVGRHLGIQAHGPHAATLRFDAKEPGYSGWEWHAVLACAPGSTTPTVNELALMPGAAALKVPKWVPYEQRLRKGDLQPTTVLPPRPDDPSLVEDEQGHLVLSEEGVARARRRWRDGKFGPGSDFARHAAHPCGTCGFFVSLEDTFGPQFGVCANEFSADGHVVHERNGCGAHTLTPAVEHSHAPEPFDDEQF